MNNIYVLDTNVLLDDPTAIFDYEEHEIIIPLAVVEELDNQKRKTSDIGYNARETSRILDELRLKGRLNEGIELENGSILKIVIDKKEKSNRGGRKQAESKPKAWLIASPYT